MKFSQAVVDAVRSVLRQYNAVDLLSRDALLANLTFIYHAIKGSENLLQVAIDCTGSRDPLHTYFVEHLKEERSHEKWLADDLATAGIDVAQTLVSRHAVEMVGSQYYLIYHVDPAALLGYMVLMECFPLSPEAVDTLADTHGEALLRTLRYHSIHDIDHGGDLLDAIDALSEGRQLIVLQSAVQSAHYIAAASAMFG